MAATFVVETGAGLSDANSYLSHTNADLYWENHGAPATWTGTQAVKEAALRIATQYLDNTYLLRWRGTRAKQAQALDWPRVGAVDPDGYEFSSSALPQELKDATAEVAWRYLKGTALMPDVTAEDRQLSAERVKIGPLEVDQEWAGTKGSGIRFALIDAILDALIFSAGIVMRA